MRFSCAYLPHTLYSKRRHGGGWTPNHSFSTPPPTGSIWKGFGSFWQAKADSWWWERRKLWVLGTQERGKVHPPDVSRAQRNTPFRQLTDDSLPQSSTNRDYKGFRAMFEQRTCLERLVNRKRETNASSADQERHFLKNRTLSEAGSRCSIELPPSRWSLPEWCSVNASSAQASILGTFADFSDAIGSSAALARLSYSHYSPAGIVGARQTVVELFLLPWAAQMRHILCSANACAVYCWIYRALPTPLPACPQSTTHEWSWSLLRCYCHQWAPPLAPTFPSPPSC